MHDIRKIDVMENIYDENDRIAAHVNDHMTNCGVLVVNEMGAPGVGKTTTIRNIVDNLTFLKPYVIEGDIESDLDTQTLNKLGIDTFQINTYGACHLDAPSIDQMLDIMLEKINMNHSENVGQKGILFIENIGNLVCPAEFSIGEHVKMLVSTVTEGSDKPYKYPLAFEKADIIVLNKVDLIPYLDFDEEFFMKGVRALNKEVPVFKVSGKTGEGYKEVALWLEKRAKELRVSENSCGHTHEHTHDHSHESGHTHEHSHEHSHESGHTHNHSHNHEHINS